MNNLEMRHPESDLLLPWLDGELTARQARRVRKHVEACWQCRTELDHLQRTVAACIRYRRDLLQPSLPPPPLPWSDLTQGFARVDSALRPRLFQRPVFRWAALVATAASLAAATWTLRTTIFPPAEKPAKIRLPQPNPTPAFPRVESSPAGQIARPDGSAPSGHGDLSAPPLPAASLGDELQAVAALHQLGADLGEPVEVTRQDSRIVVSGTGVSPELQNRIRTALTSVPHVLVRFSDPDLPAQPAVADNNPAATAASPAVPNRLETQLGGRSQLESFSSELLQHNEAAMTRAYALRRLAQQFPSAAETQLTPEERRLLRNLAREHLAAMVREIAAIDRTASPVLQALGGAASPPARTDLSTWQAAAAPLFASARAVETLLAALLGAAAPDLPANTLPSRLSGAVAQLQADMQQCERLLTQ